MKRHKCALKRPIITGEIGVAAIFCFGDFLWPPTMKHAGGLPVRHHQTRTLPSPDAPAAISQHSERMHGSGVSASAAWSAAVDADVHCRRDNEVCAVGATAPAWDIGLAVHVGEHPVVVETPFPTYRRWSTSPLTDVAPEPVSVVRGTAKFASSCLGVASLFASQAPA